jgi:tRNA nucleotidyltransferase (CCA-adding enzyme)
MNRYRFPKNKMTRIQQLIQNHMFHYTDEWTDAAVRRFIRKIELSYLEDQYLLRQADIEGMSSDPIPENYYGLRDLKLRVGDILQEGNAFTVRDLAVNGKDIITSTGFPGGPKVGIILDFLLESVLDDPRQNNREKLLEIAERYSATLD